MKILEHQNDLRAVKSDEFKETYHAVSGSIVPSALK